MAVQQFWKAYFFFLILYEVIGAGLNLGNGELMAVLLRLPYMGFAVGLYGLAFERPILARVVWRYVFAFALLFYALDWLVKPILYLSKTSISLTTMAYIQAFSLPLLPLLYALNLYAWKRKALWGSDALDSEQLPRVTRSRLALYLLTLFWLLLFPVFGANAAHFGWGFFPLIASGIVVPLLAMVLFADLWVTLAATWRVSGTANAKRFTVPAVSACLFLGCGFVAALMYL